MDWAGRRVLVTGHTGFKGAWLALWLAELGAEVHGLAGPPPTDPSLYADARVGELLAGEHHVDVRDPSAVAAAVHAARPEAVFHLAAQAIVRRSLVDPAGTWATNVVGTANLLTAIEDATRAVVVVTSDKCYRDVESGRPMTEDDALGGRDPYSASKAAQELVAASYRDTLLGPRGVQVATARAGNVIGGGDWAPDRLVPDLVRARRAGAPLVVRNPDAVRPWQHVLSPLGGYLRLAEALLAGPGYAEAWNFGPAETTGCTVRELVARWPDGPPLRVQADPDGGRESTLLRLDSAKARERLGYAPWCGADAGLRATMEWYASADDPRDRSLAQIRAATA